MTCLHQVGTDLVGFLRLGESLHVVFTSVDFVTCHSIFVVIDEVIIVLVGVVVGVITIQVIITILTGFIFIV